MCSALEHTCNLKRRHTNCFESGDKRHRINPGVWNTFLYTNPCSVVALMSHVKMLPSKPDVTNKLSLVEYSIFLTQFMWPCKLRTFVDRFRLSHNATVESSEHVANVVFVRNLLCCNANRTRINNKYACISDGMICEKDENECTHLTQLTESWCAFFTAFICLFEIGSKSTIAFFSQAATIRLLRMKKVFP